MDGALFTGLGVALATPFATVEEPAGKPGHDGGRNRKRWTTPDIAAYRRLVRHVVRGGADVLVCLGSTGEAATVTDEERRLLVHAAVTATAASGSRVPVVVGVGHNDTERTLELAEQAVRCGASGLLVVTPYYSRPQPAGVEAHFRAVSEALPGVPVIVYNVPGRTGSNLAPETLARLWQIPEVVAVKESSGDLRQMARVCREAPPGKVVLAGDDDLALAGISVGAEGLVSVCGNVAPAATAALVAAARRGDLDRARRLQTRLAPLMTALFAETNPVPVKAALACLGIGAATVRSPLAPAAPETWDLVRNALAALDPERDLGHPPVTVGARPALEAAR